MLSFRVFGAQRKGDGMAKTLRDIKAGDTVCVVWQRELRDERPPVIEEKVVEKVGNKYFYFKRNGWDTVKIDRDTGMSVHQDCCVRANGRGCDVYLCEADYIHELTVEQQWRDLRSRLKGQWGDIPRDLPHDVVMKIHAVLDEAGWRK